MLQDPSTLNLLLDYAKQDSLSLHKALSSAQTTFINNYNVDITSVVSLPSLALKIFRLKFLSFNIPILNRVTDSFVRKSYYGSAVDIYKGYARNAYYYDINSLYPYAMKNRIPLKPIQTFYEEDTDFNFDNFFGFMDIDIQCPEHLSKPVLPYKQDGRTIFPQGVFSGVYFSEEVRACVNLGYKILKVHKAVQYSQECIFSDYVDAMYKLKAKSVGPERFVSKLLLNSLYGIFGRRQETLKTVVVSNSMLPDLLGSHVIKTIINIDNDNSIVLMIDNLDAELIGTLNSVISDFNMKPSVGKTVKSNVAIASAITAYARIKMIPYKIMDGAIYSDTDSIITTDKLDDSLIGTELGLMKDELNGNIIQEIYVLGCKQYGYWYNDENNTKIERSVWAGITRNSLSFKDIKDLFEGKFLSRVSTRFFRSLQKLSITIKNIKTTISYKPHKILKDNVYQPIKINSVKKPYVYDPKIHKLQVMIDRLRKTVNR